MEMIVFLRKTRFRLKLGFIILVCLIILAVVLLLKRQERAAVRLLKRQERDQCRADSIHGNGYCSDYLGPTLADDLAKIDSIKFNGIEQYTTDLFPPLTRDPEPPELPVFVTALTSNHYNESLFLLEHLKETVRAKYKDLKVIVYDLGLTTQEAIRIEDACSCELWIFQFDMYPKHVRTVTNYSWKPLVIQTVVKEHPLVFWLDASVRFKTSDLDTLIADVKKYGLMADDVGPMSFSTITERTHKATFAFMQESPCTYEDYGEIRGGLVLIFANQFITKYFLRPWVSCALSFGCMEPMWNSRSCLTCPDNKIDYTYHLCHRFDQSILGILFVRLFHREMKNHKISKEYFNFCRFPGMDEEHCD